MKPKTIEIFLPDGDPAGVRRAEVKNRTIQLISFPRARLGSDLGISKEGVYFLFGIDEDAGDRPLVYIGQAKDCLARLKQHHQDPRKDYWNTAAVVVSKDGSFGTTEIEYLERVAVRQAKSARRFAVKNENVPSTSSLSDSQKSLMEEDFECIELLLPAIGYPVFSSVTESLVESEQFYCEGSGIAAKAVYGDAGMVVLKGSRMRRETTPTVSKGIILLRQRLLEQGIVSEEDDGLVFVQDYPFSSPSAASASVLGRSSNGWLDWRNSDKKPMQEVFRST